MGKWTKTRTANSNWRPTLCPFSSDWPTPARCRGPDSGRRLRRRTLRWTLLLRCSCRRGDRRSFPWFWSDAWTSSMFSSRQESNTENGVTKSAHFEFFFQMGHTRPLFLYFFVFSIHSWQKTNVQYKYKFLPMTGFEPRTSGIGSDRSTNWATTTTLLYVLNH